MTVMTPFSRGHGESRYGVGVSESSLSRGTWRPAWRASVAWLTRFCRGPGLISYQHQLGDLLHPVKMKPDNGDRVISQNGRGVLFGFPLKPLQKEYMLQK